MFKKIILLLLYFSFMFIGCIKSNSEDSESEKYINLISEFYLTNEFEIIENGLVKTGIYINNNNELYFYSINKISYYLKNDIFKNELLLELENGDLEKSYFVADQKALRLSEVFKNWNFEGEKILIEEVIKKDKVVLDVENNIKKYANGEFVMEKEKVISVFGSSVALGVGGLNWKGYASTLEQRLSPENWKFYNHSVGGNNTISLLNRFDEPTDPALEVGYVIIGLSLANEGITGGNPDQIYEQYKNNMQELIVKFREKNIIPIVGLCYPYGQYNDKHYKYVKDMNILVNSWDVSSINFLGAVDDGTGKWVEGYYSDIAHPSVEGHAEMYYTIVPTLFDALQQNKEKVIKSNGKEYLKFTDTDYLINFKPEDKIHSFSLSFNIKANEEGIVANLNTEKGNSYLEIEKETGNLIYKLYDGIQMIMEKDILDSNSHNITFVHRYAKGESLIFIDGELLNTINEKIDINEFEIGGMINKGTKKNSVNSEYQELMIFRAALNDDEVRVINDGKLLQASLEIYSPLSAVNLSEGEEIINLAQSLSKCIIKKSN